MVIVARSLANDVWLSMYVCFSGLCRQVGLKLASFKASSTCSVRRPMSASITVDSKCEACEGLSAPLTPGELEAHLPLIPAWKLNEDRNQISRSWKTRNFAAALDFVNRVGQLAEAEGHHPDIAIRSYNLVQLDLSTHFVKGLTTNDIIMAVKIDTLPIELKKAKKKPVESGS